jgi:hypothetical protein
MIWNVVTISTLVLVLGAALLRLRSGKVHPVALGAMIFPPFVLATHPPAGRALFTVALGALVLILLYSSAPKPR